MSKQHTEVPWYAAVDNTQVNSEKWGYVARVHWTPKQGSADANAYLIAAAPDLLAACKTVLAYLEEVSSDAEKYHPNAVKPLRAAIAKAEGRAE